MKTALLIISLCFLASCSAEGGDTTNLAIPGKSQSPKKNATVNAGSDQTVHVGDVVFLSGSSTTTDKKPEHSWRFVSLPAGSQATLDDPTILTPKFTADVIGLYVLVLELDVGLSVDVGPSDQVQIDVQANTLTLHFTGTFGTDATVHGSFTYEITQGPIGSNVRGLSPNVVYRLSTWDIVVDSASLEGLLPSTTYRQDQPSNTVEFCEGHCIFASPDAIQLTFQNASGFVLTLAFGIQDPTPSINPPSIPGEWGPFVSNASTYRVPCPVCGPLAVIQTGALT